MTDVPGFLPPPPPPAGPPLQPPPPPPPPPVAVERPGLLELLGPRAERRPEPRLGVTMAGSGAALAVFGAVALGGNRLVGEGGDGSQYPGLAISLLVVVLGVTLNTLHRTGPLAAAGVAASATAMVPLAFFVTYSDSPSSGNPVAFSTILFLATVGWVAGYVLGPGRGHGLYLGAAVIGLWLWILEVTEHVFSFPTDAAFEFLRVPIDPDALSSGRFSDTPSVHALGAYTLAFAAAYLFAAQRLDRSGHRGLATPLTFGGVITLIAGIALFADDLKQAGTGLVYLAAGLGMAYLGAIGGRRLTNIVGGVLVFGGATAIVAKPFDTLEAFAVAEMAAGAVVVAVAHVIATTWSEPAETEPVVSRFYSGGSVQPSGPPPPPAGSVLG